MSHRFVLFLLLVRKTKPMLFRLLPICLKKHVDEKKYIDVGVGVEHQLGVTRNRLDTAVAILKEKGYDVINIQILQVRNR